MRILLFVLPLFLVQPVYAYEGIFKILDEHYVETASDLPESKDLKPDMNWQSSGHIRAWVDIVGFKNTVKIDNISYIRGDPADDAIVKYDAYAYLTSNINGLRHITNCYWCVLDSINKSVSGKMDGTNYTVTLTVTIQWHENIENSGSTQRFSYTETATFEDSKLSPEIYAALPEPQIIITQYNNSMYENVGIKILGDNYTKVSFKYHDKQAVRTSKILHVENDSKGIAYGNATDLEQWEMEGTGISRFYNEILLDGNLSKMDINEFDIRVYNPFTDRKADPRNFTIERVEFIPQKIMNGLLIAVIGIVSTFSIGTLYLFNRSVSRWNIRLF